MIVHYDEENFSVKLYRDVVKGKLVGLMEVIPIDELLDVWEKHKADPTEPRINCSTCGYSPQTPSCDTCEGYSNWYALDPCDECVFVRGSGWCDNCNGKPKGLDALPNSRKAEQTEPSTDCGWK